ncbi:hypothetical protein RGQ29_002332 [Quercus rubra]|uniref:Disease resistance N-terminal domain-containing protein n=1 Tax=Quercus rubra TaxID=3512 RepID=A0AAN7ICU3_QUERU|nr:hypothetical protein RGQ29_002332 [Quercus rubra]
MPNKIFFCRRWVFISDFPLGSNGDLGTTHSSPHESKAEYIVEILLGVFVEGLLAKLRSIFVEQHISFELGFMEGLTDLFSGLTKIQLVLNGVEKRQASDEFLRSWLARLRHVAYDIDDVLDEFGYNILQQELTHEACKKIPSWKITNSMTTDAKCCKSHQKISHLSEDIFSNVKDTSHSTHFCQL